MNLLPLGSPALRRVLDRMAADTKHEEAHVALRDRHHTERESLETRQQRERDELMDRR